MVNREERTCTKEFKEQMIKAYKGCKLKKHIKYTDSTEKNELIKLKKENIQLKKENAILKKVAFMLVRK